MKTSSPQSIHSIGHACQLLQAMPTAIRDAAEALKIEPAIRINGIPHYVEADLERIRKHLASPPVRKSRRK
jgi:hypothetical protein